MGKSKTRKKLSGIRLYLLIVLLDIIIGGIGYYCIFPAINIHNLAFWLILIFFISFDTLLIAFSHFGDYFDKYMTGRELLKSIGKDALFVLLVDCAIVLIVLAGNLMGLKLFRAKDYASLIQVEERNFTEDFQECESVSNIALMDTESARIFGNREIGSLSDVVSQYEVADDYNQINISGIPMKVSSLKYASFFKWVKNRKSGVPGYVQVNAVNSDANYVKLNQGMKYVPSGYFNDNLQRHVQFQYPTKIIDDYYFEVDDNGNPYYICPCLSSKIGLFSAMDVVGAIICDPITGNCEYYNLKDIPNWVDRVFDGELCTRKYDWNGTLSGGYWNSIISQTGCKKTTDDYGYVTLDDDVWIYTGVTSLNSDQSNVGFVMVNQRTSETRYYSVSGAEEYSAMKSAEGAVQEKNYDASFPALINVMNQPTYIMVLKDSGGLVKMYAMVNVEQYNIVATGNTQNEVFSNYKKLLLEEGVDNSSDDTTENFVDITVDDIQYITTEGETTVYIKGTNGIVFKQAFAENEALIYINAGDKIKLYTNYTEELAQEAANANVVYSFTEFEFIEKATTAEPAF